MADTTNIELERINEFVTQLVRITQIDGAFVYGVDKNGNSVKIACSTLTDTSELDTRVRAVEARSQTNSSDITTLRTSLSGKANAVHTHNIADVIGLQNELNGKATSAQIEELTEEIAATNNALNNKSDVGHTHNISDVVNLQTELDGKAAAVHTHTIANVNGLQPELDNINSLIAAIGQQQGFPQVSDLDGFEAAVGTIAMYIGETTEHYTHVNVYEKTATNTWKQTDTQPRTSILYNSDTENLTIGNISDLTPSNSDND